MTFDEFMQAQFKERVFPALDIWAKMLVADIFRYQDVIDNIVRDKITGKDKNITEINLEDISRIRYCNRNSSAKIKELDTYLSSNYDDYNVDSIIELTKKVASKYFSTEEDCRDENKVRAYISEFRSINDAVIGYWMFIVDMDVKSIMQTYLCNA